MPDKSAMNSSPNAPSFIYDDLPLHWQMTRCEKYGFAALLRAAQPEVAIEVGTHKGGSLQVIAKVAKKVYSLDILPECSEQLRPYFDNVEFLTGDSRLILPPLLDRIRRATERLGFVLIDGDHSSEGVRADINAVLKYRPNCPVYIVFHDSFNPQCRKGILSADWADCPYVHYVEVDFIPGVFHREAFDTAEPRSMYGGLAVSLMLPSPRDGDIILHQSQKGLYDAVFAKSRYASPLTRTYDLLRIAKGKLLR